MISRLTVAAPYMVYDGYGSMAEHLVLGMLRAGVQVHPLPLALDLAGCTSEFRKIVKWPWPPLDTPLLVFCWPHQVLDWYSAIEDLFSYTTCESSQLCPWWPGRLNRCQRVIVTTRFAARVFRDSGVVVPIHVVPQGIDPEIYHYMERPLRKTVTTLMVATGGRRKHMAEGIEAWRRAFAGDESARLLIKSRFGTRGLATDDFRIRVIDATEHTRGIAHYYQQADVLMALGSEGFGLPLVEGMATGLPVIALSSEGQGDICEDVPELLLPVPPGRWERADEWGGSCGIRGVPDIAAIEERLRWMVEHRAEAGRMGQAASSWAIQHRDVRRLGAHVLDVINRNRLLRAP